MKLIIVRDLGCAQASWMNKQSDRESMQLLLNRLATFEAEWRGVTLAFCLVIGARGRSCRQKKEKGGTRMVVEARKKSRPEH